MMNIAKCFAFLGCPVIVKEKLPFEISDGIVLKKPTEGQLKKIKNYLSELNSTFDCCAPFENNIVESVKRSEDTKLPYNVVEYNEKPLDKSEWRYYVITFDVGEFNNNYNSTEFGNTAVSDLRCASSLSQIPLRLKPVFYEKLNFKTSKYTEDWEYYSHTVREGGNSTEIDNTNLSELRLLYSKFCEIKTSHSDIARSIKMFNSLPKFKGYNELFSLGLFAIIESLITHNPAGEYDSIGHQIRHKIPLLERRCDNPIDYSVFGDSTQQTLWSKLYDYRSRVAHGGNIDFSGKLQILRDAYTVQLFLESVLSTLLRHALNEPDLYTDLRKC